MKVEIHRLFIYNWLKGKQISSAAEAVACKAIELKSHRPLFYGSELAIQSLHWRFIKSLPEESLAWNQANKLQDELWPWNI